MIRMTLIRRPLMLLMVMATWLHSSHAQEFVGSAACQTCHQSEYTAWMGSNHQEAMQAATEATVLGDFKETTFEYAGVTSRFFRQDGKFLVRTDSADGTLQDFEITHTFGVYPLQQYLVSFPDGRLQTLGIAWDTRPAVQGGQRWFHVYPDEAITHGDELHWTGPQQNWNFMCADCHSTNLQKNYTASSDSFATSWSEISVGCEACHGPGSAHVSWAGAPETERQPSGYGLSFQLNERKGVSWPVNEKTGKPERSQLNTTRREIEVCAACHSRRGILAEGAAREASFLDHYLPALLTEGLYHADGQIQDEVYVWGSFKQSKMYAAGVTCSDCHDPHSQKLKAPADGVCAQCHLPARYASVSHHHHPSESSGASCANCHMPESTYMVVDPRRDHSMRIPRPDHSVQFGVPNACTQCHSGKSNDWAAATFSAWYPEPKDPFQSWTAAFQAARQVDPTAGAQLAQLIGNVSVPDIARATAVLELEPYLDPQTAPALQAALQDESPLVRMAAVRVMGAFPVASVLPFTAHLLQDDLLSVRTEAARVLASASRTQMNEAGGELIDAAVAEYTATQQLNADRAEGQMNLGNLFVSLGNPELAESHFRLALKREPGFVPAWINLADLYRSQGMDRPAVETLQKGLVTNPDSGALLHALGLSLVRQGQEDPALQALSRAVEVEPENARFAYVNGVALNSSGKPLEAMMALKRAHERHPANRDILFALATISRDQGLGTEARQWALKLLELNPGDTGAQALLESLQTGGE